VIEELISASSQAITRETIVVASSDQVASDLGEEVVILNLKDGIYYGLDAVGASVWGMLQEARQVGSILDALLAEYDVEPTRCEQDLLDLLASLKAAALIEVKDAPER